MDRYERKFNEKRYSTMVVNLSTGEEQLFSLPPEEAVVAAYEQDKGNYNTWRYPIADEHPNFVRGKRSVACGDFTALIK